MQITNKQQVYFTFPTDDSVGVKESQKKMVEIPDF